MSRIPTAEEFAAWKADYKRRYAAPIVELGRAAMAFAAVKAPDIELIDGEVRNIPGTGSDGLTIDSEEDFDTAVKPLNEAIAAMDGAEKQAMVVGACRAYGYDTGRAGKPATANPYEDRTDEFYSWYRYWLSGNKDFVRSNPVSI